MFDLFRMDLRRLVRSKSFYIVLAVTAAFIFLMVLMIAAVSSPEAVDAMQSSGVVVVGGDTSEIDGMREQLKTMYQLEFVHGCLSSGFLLVMTGIGMTLFAYSDFSSGYVKNICFARPRRWDYVCSKVLVAGVYSVILVVLGLLITLVCPVLFGLQMKADPIAHILQYAFWLWIPVWAFGLMGLALVLLTRSSTLGIVLAVCSGSGIIGELLKFVCQQFGWPDVSQYLLSFVVGEQCVPWTAAPNTAMILACAAAWAGVYLAGSLITMQTRDI